ncbi:hypothetical protein F5X97DRAFT_269736 [Nemania serpens]|nr:hypothetical protein F5X97DRAFT_269736 [Nemania serpens]
MMSHKSPSRQHFETLRASRSKDNQVARDCRELAPPQSQPLRHLSVSQSQNRQSQVNQLSCNPRWGILKNNSNEKRVGGQLTRPSITYSTFEPLSAVAESESQTQSVYGTSGHSDDAQHILQLPVGPFSTHPLSIAACNIPPLKEQLAKHRDGLFEWILAVRVPGDSTSQRDCSDTHNSDNSKEYHKAYFGCNLLPESPPGANDRQKATRPAGGHLLLVTSLRETKDVLEVFRDPVNESDMALLEAKSGLSTPAKASDYSSLPEILESPPSSTVCTRGDDSFVESTISRSPINPVTRIEDSFEALDTLEDQLEAFGQVARFGQFVPTEKHPSTRESTGKSTLATSSPSVRFATPQPQRPFTQPSSASLRVKAASEPRKTALRKATSMTFDLHKSKAEDKVGIQPSPKTSLLKGVTNFSLQRPVTKSTKQCTIPSFELPGEAVARQLKEKKEARLASHRATQPTAASLRRAKSAKLPTRPTFELPGEAISRRKREEHQAQLKAQEEEEKKRREFKARPLPSHAVPATMPRETITSRARQNKPALTENSAQAHPPSKRLLTGSSPHLRPALSSTINQSQPRGRTLRAEGGLILQASRATSASTASLSSQRSPLSIEDIQMQKLRGHEIYQRDNSLTGIRNREKYERESLAKIAREEAAERSRQKSREWAEKQARKQRSVGCLRDVVV